MTAHAREVANVYLLHHFPCRNGPDWSRLRKASQGILMKPRSVDVFLPHVDEVVQDFVQYIDSKRDPSTHKVHSIHEELNKWSFECKIYSFCLDSSK